MSENNRGRQRVLHVITSLGQGGAETVLFRLVQATLDGFDHHVISMHDEGVFAARLRDLGVAVTVLGMRRGALSAGGLRRLRRVLVKFRPDLVQTRLDHANLVGGVMARWNHDTPCIWAVHSTDLGSFRASWKTRAVRVCCALLSRRLPRAIVSDSASGAALHARSGFDAAKFVVVPNGVDSIAFRPDDLARARVRATWGLAPDELLLGCVARWDPAKDHENLIHALKLLAPQRENWTCVLVGNGMTAENTELRAILERYGVSGRVRAVGPTADVPGAMAAIDLHVLASQSESQPVAVIEAMACATPCVVTDVGDAGAVVGETGWIVPPRDPQALCTALKAAIDSTSHTGFAERRQSCRDRAVAEFSLSGMASRYALIWSRFARPRAES